MTNIITDRISLDDDQIEQAFASIGPKLAIGSLVTKTRPRPGGRPRLGREKRVRYLVTLEPSTAAAARRLAAGNLSGGITRAITAMGTAVAAPTTPDTPDPS